MKSWCSTIQPMKPHFFPVVYMALSVQNTMDVMQGFFGHQSAFVRTPKFNANRPAFTQYLLRKNSGMAVLETVVLLYFLPEFA